jgi:RNA polymerase sigma factor (sigma-70 family)
LEEEDMTDFNVIEQEMRPIAYARAKRFGLDPDDAVQEARIAMFRALERYDPARSFKPYMSEVITNTYKSMYGHARSGIRCPTVHERGPNGEYVPVRRLPSPMGLDEDDYHANPHTETPEHEVDEVMRERVCAAFIQEAMKRLPAKERTALALRLASSTSSSAVLSKQMGLCKNDFDWIVNKLRFQITKLAIEEDTPLRDYAESKEWPRCQTSVGVRYHGAFAVRTMKARGRVPARQGVIVMESCAAGSRAIELHTWGAVLVCIRQGRVYTSVIEGRLNPRSGEIHGVHYTKLFVDVPGYPAIAKGLASPGAMRRSISSLEEIKVGGE